MLIGRPPAAAKGPAPFIPAPVEGSATDRADHAGPSRRSAHRQKRLVAEVRVRDGEARNADAVYAPQRKPAHRRSVRSPSTGAGIKGLAPWPPAGGLPISRTIDARGACAEEVETLTSGPMAYDVKANSSIIAERARPRAGAVFLQGDRLHRRGSAEAHHRHCQHVDRDDAVQLQPAPAGRAA